MADRSLADILAERSGAVPSGFAEQNRELLEGDPTRAPDDNYENLVDAFIIYAAEQNTGDDYPFFTYRGVPVLPSTGALAPPTEDASLDEINRAFARAAGRGSAAATDEPTRLEHFTRDDIVRGIRSGTVNYSPTVWATFLVAAKTVRQQLSERIGYDTLKPSVWRLALIRNEETRLVFVPFVSAYSNWNVITSSSVSATRMDVIKARAVLVAKTREVWAAYQDVEDALAEVAAGSAQVRIGWSRNRNRMGPSSPCVGTPRTSRFNVDDVLCCP